MHDVLGRFFQAVLLASLLTLASGVWMLGRVAKQVVQSGGSFEMPLAWTVMAALGAVMVGDLHAHPLCAFQAARRCRCRSEWAAAGAALAQIAHGFRPTSPGCPGKPFRHADALGDLSPDPADLFRAS